jgi:hypothetical protein
MSSIDRHLPFVKEQIEFQEKMAARYDLQPWRRELHLKSANNFKELAKDIMGVQKRLDELLKRTDGPDNIYKKISLTLDDIEGLPNELMQELSISDADKLEFSIVSIINDAGGILSLDKILVGLYRKTGEVYKRNVLTSRLYRMRQKGVIFNVPNKPGCYSTGLISEQESKRIFGQEDVDSIDNA